MATGTPVLSNHATALDLMVGCSKGCGLHCVTQREDAEREVRLLLTDSAEWYRMALCGHLHTNRKNMFRHRMLAVLQDIARVSSPPRILHEVERYLPPRPSPLLLPPFPSFRALAPVDVNVVSLAGDVELMSAMLPFGTINRHSAEGLDLCALAAQLRGPITFFVRGQDSYTPAYFESMYYALLYANASAIVNGRWRVSGGALTGAQVEHVYVAQAAPLAPGSLCVLTHRLGQLPCSAALTVHGLVDELQRLGVRVYSAWSDNGYVQGDP